MDRNLTNLTIGEEDLLTSNKTISQTTPKEQNQYCNTFLDEFDEEEFSEAVNDIPEFKQRDRLDSEHWNRFYGGGGPTMKIQKQQSKSSSQTLSSMFDSDIKSLKIFVRTIKQYCLQFSDYQSKTYKKYDFLVEHEDALRSKFQK